MSLISGAGRAGGGRGAPAPPIRLHRKFYSGAAKKLPVKGLKTCMSLPNTLNKLRCFCGPDKQVDLMQARETEKQNTNNISSSQQGQLEYLSGCAQPGGGADYCFVIRVQLFVTLDQL